MESHVLHIISSGKQTLARVKTIIHSIHPYLDVFQIREKQQTARTLMAWAQTLLAEGLPASKLSMNDRLDVGLAVRAGHIHLAYHSLPPSEAKPLLFPGQKLGVSVHDVKEAELAEENGADFLYFGHVYPTHSKPGMAPRGIHALEKVVHSVSIPVIALGGITLEKVYDILATGCAGLAVMSAVMKAENPEATIMAFRREMDKVTVHPVRIQKHI
ncbi:thiamine phosphate synthase [Aneurinibacillus terranovensis]|uniref:thiamine phosphate synthase n=1 Tax=Aneurinibacillus terranovensis TaxID=278991 RepID=UPI00042A1285|nr:thiamine phosphate synthase [Aneurinibacillus terranovensis]